MQTRILFGLATVLLLVGCGSEQMNGVGPWDTNDHPDPSSAGGSPLADPPGIIHAKGYYATLPNGIVIHFQAICRSLEGTWSGNSQLTQRAWTPDGAPYDYRFTNGSNSIPVTDAADKPGARHLIFDLDFPTAQDFEIYGYVPDGARSNTPHPELHGRAIPMGFTMERSGKFGYRIPVVVEGASASRYRFAIATGDWTTVDTITRIPNPAKTQDLKTGAYGTLRMIEPAPEPMDVSRPYVPTVTFEINPMTEPVLQSYRICLLDKTGAEITRWGSRFAPFKSYIAAARLGDVASIKIQARPYTYVEFSDVHFDPDPKLWGTTHWGKEGNSTLQSIPGETDLVGILRPQIDGQAWNETEFFANDGNPWKESGREESFAAQFSTGSWPKGEVLVGLFNIDQSVIDDDRNVAVEAYASDSSEPGKGLKQKLDGLFNYVFTRTTGQAMFVRPDTPYVQFKVQTADKDWTKVGEVAPPSESLSTYSKEDKEAMSRGTKVYIDAFTAIIRKAGSLDFFYKTSTATTNTLKQNLVTWNPDNCEVRLVARLKSGDTMELHQNGGSGDGSRDFIFSLDEQGSPVLDSYRSRVKLKNITAFIIEKRNYSPPTYLVAKLPPASK